MCICRLQLANQTIFRSVCTADSGRCCHDLFINWWHDWRMNQIDSAAVAVSYDVDFYVEISVHFSRESRANHWIGDWYACYVVCFDCAYSRQAGDRRRWFHHDAPNNRCSAVTCQNRMKQRLCKSFWGFYLSCLRKQLQTSSAAARGRREGSNRGNSTYSHYWYNDLTLAAWRTTQSHFLPPPPEKNLSLHDLEKVSFRSPGYSFFICIILIVG